MAKRPFAGSRAVAFGLPESSMLGCADIDLHGNRKAVQGKREEMETVLALEGISKFFAGVKALMSVSFNVRAGEIHALLGENGVSIPR